MLSTRRPVGGNQKGSAERRDQLEIKKWPLAQDDSLALERGLVTIARPYGGRARLDRSLDLIPLIFDNVCQES